MTHLADVNVLLALSWPNHEFHEAAKRWLESLDDAWATCPLTECGFIRISINFPSRPRKITPLQAQHALREIRQRKGHAFLAEDTSALQMDLRGVTGHNQITDAYLVSAARRHGAVLSTFDKTIFAHRSTPEFVNIIPAS